MTEADAFLIPIEQILLSVVLLIFFSLVVMFVSARMRAPKFLSLMLLYWHFLFSIVYFFYIRTYGGDAFGYYSEGIAGFELGLGGEFVRGVVYILHNLGFGFFPMYLFFGFWGYVGAYLILVSLFRVGVYSRYLRVAVIVLIFLPSMHFWSSAVGKDAVSFCALGFVMFSCVARKNRYLIFSLGVGLMLLVRPHMAAILMASGFIGYVYSSQITLPLKIILSGMMALAGMSAAPFFLDQAGVGADAGLSEFSEYVEMRQTKNLQGDTSIDIANMSLPGRLFSYIFRPSLIDGGGVFSLISALDNTMILCVFTFLLFQFRDMRGSLVGWNIVLFAYFVMAWIILANTTANLGISARQKWMFVPCLYFFLVFINSRRFLRTVDA